MNPRTQAVDALGVRAHEARLAGQLGEARAALDEATRLLEDVVTTAPQTPAAVRRWLTLHTMALEVCLDLRDAVGTCRAAVAAAGAVVLLGPDDPQVAASAAWLSSALHRLGDGESTPDPRLRHARRAVDVVLAALPPAAAPSAHEDAEEVHPVVAMARAQRTAGFPTELGAPASWAETELDAATAATTAAISSEDLPTAVTAHRRLVEALVRVGRRDAALERAQAGPSCSSDDGVGPWAAEVALTLAGAALEAEHHRLAQQAARDALAIVGDDAPQMQARAHHLLGLASAYLEDPEEARRHLEAADALVGRLAPDPITQPQLAALAADVIADLAFVYRRLGDRDSDQQAAARGLDRVQELLEAGAAVRPAVVARALGRAMATLALSQPVPHNAAGPERVSLARALLEAACDHDPGDIQLRAMLGHVAHLETMLLAHRGDFEAATTAHGRAAASLKVAWAVEPSSVWTRSNQCEQRTVAAVLALRRGNSALAGRELREVISLRRQLTHARPDSPWALRRVAVAQRELLRAARAVGSRSTALRAAEGMVEAARGRTALAPPDPCAADDLAEALVEAATTAAQLGASRAQRTWRAELVTLRRGQHVSSPSDPVVRIALAEALLDAADGGRDPGGAMLVEAAEVLDAVDAADRWLPGWLVLRCRQAELAVRRHLQAGDAAAGYTALTAALRLPLVCDPNGEPGRRRLTNLVSLADALDGGGPARASVSESVPGHADAETAVLIERARRALRGIADVSAAPVQPVADEVTRATPQPPVEVLGAHEPTAMRFGAGLACGGDLLVVGAPGGSALMSASLDQDGDEAVASPDQQVGTVVVLRRRGARWEREAWLRPDEQAGIPGSRFGWAVATDGERIVIGAPGAAIPGAPPGPRDAQGQGTGAAYVFVQGSDGWVLEDRLDPPPGEPAARFGAAVAIEGSTIVVADDAAGGAGAVGVYDRSGPLWRGVGWLTPPAVAGPACFGAALGLADGLLVVGAPGSRALEGRDRADTAPVGAAFVYAAGPDGWGPTALLHPPPGAVGFGAAVAVEPGRVAVLAAGGSPRVVSLFHREYLDVEPMLSLVPPPEPGQGGEPPAPDDAVSVPRGGLLALDGARLLVGAVSGQPASGVAVWSEEADGWRIGARLSLLDGVGGALAADDGIVAVGIPDQGQGGVLIHHLTGQHTAG